LFLQNIFHPIPEAVWLSSMMGALWGAWRQAAASLQLFDL